MLKDFGIGEWAAAQARKPEAMFDFDPEMSNHDCEEYGDVQGRNNQKHEQFAGRK
jgi:hypothetical protein